ncbi:uncharacterized protein IL334_002014 [Kwoniella shivajii]|uniref:Mitochondrial distribution and morphology protein 12 n=1 Tax=Kwoniella shivajii TaxID=564305 RepID=A0ABZ1CUM6_9TREE|nr:hypothetical protein IL334_002014 [Kwoniella shivajii]
MSIDINWSLLSEDLSSTPNPNPNSNPGTGIGIGIGSNPSEPSDILSTCLISILNEQLKSTPRPSFIGPISITSFSFGKESPDIEIKDIRDVWRVFDQGDDEADFLIQSQSQPQPQSQSQTQLQSQSQTQLGEGANDNNQRIQERDRLRHDYEEKRLSQKGVESELKGEEKYEIINAFPHSSSLSDDDDDKNNEQDDGDDDDGVEQDDTSEIDEGEQAESNGLVKDTTSRKNGYGNYNDHSRHPSIQPQLQLQPQPRTPSKRNGLGNYDGNVNITQATPRSTSNPNPMSSPPISGTGRSFIPFHLPFDHITPNNSFTGQGVGLFSPGLNKRSTSIASFPLRPPSIMSQRNQQSLSVPVSNGNINVKRSKPKPTNHVNQSQNQVQTRNPRRPRTHTNLTRERNPSYQELDENHSNPPPISPPTHPKDLGLPSNYHYPPNHNNHNKTKSNLNNASSSTTTEIPSLQIHFHLSHTSDLNLVLLTSLQVNYPSNLFMSLPLKLSITGFTLQGEIILAYSGEKNRLHITILDDDNQSQSQSQSQSQQSSNGSHQNQGTGMGMGMGYNSRSSNEDKKLPIGQRLLPNLQIESEIGHSDAHVLRNVGKVERFIVDVIRKTLVDELVFPNFHTIAL